MVHGSNHIFGRGLTEHLNSIIFRTDAPLSEVQILNSLIILLELGHDSIQAATCNPLVPIYPKELAFLQVIPSREGVRVVHLAEFRIVPVSSEI